MTEEFKAGKIEAYEEMRTYASSMLEVDPDPAWLDMSFFAHTSVDELKHGSPIDDLEVVDF